MTARYDLSGVWSFSFEKPELGDRIVLPGTTAQAKKGKENTKSETGYLTEKYPFLGKVYYEKRVQLKPHEVGRPVSLLLERTRITKVWIDGELVGERNSLTTAHVYDVTAFIHNCDFTIRIEVSNENYPTPGGHLTSPDTQTNWIGITGKIELMVYDEVSIRRVQTKYHGVNQDKKHELELQVEICNEGESCTELLYIAIEKKYLLKGTGKVVYEEIKPFQAIQTLSIQEGEGRYPVIFIFEEEPELWSEYTPILYRISLKLGEGTVFEIETGLRSFEAKGCYFYINGNQTMLRGKHDGMIFPLEGAAPTDISSWLKVMGIAKEYGVNHYRFHTCCPPEAAFEAADLLGIYMEPELPFWGTVTEEGEEGHNAVQQEYLIQEGFRILQEFGNHPSFCMMSMGNELWGSKKRIGEIVAGYKAVDNRVLYTQGSNNFQFIPEILPEEDFFVAVRLGTENEKGVNDRLVRGSCACCDAPFGHVQNQEPGTSKNYNHALFPEDGRWEPKIPVVTHEIGQYEMYPDYCEIEKYQGVLKPENFRIFKERLEEKGMKNQAFDFFQSSGRLAIQCYQEELEAMHRTKYIAGYQILDLQDFTGQGTALVGVLNSFMESKGLITPEEWRSFSSDCVLLAQFERYCVESGQEFTWDMALSYFNWNEPLAECEIEWKIILERECIAEGTERIADKAYGYIPITKRSICLPEVSVPSKMELQLFMKERNKRKTYTLWVFPQNEDFLLHEGEIENKETKQKALVTTDYEEACEYLEQGGKVLFVSQELPWMKEKGIPGMYCTNFWNFPMFRSICEDKGVEIPTGTLGLLIQEEHPALREFPCETWSTPQWYWIAENSSCVALEKEFSKEYRPIVQVIDNVERNHKLGILFEIEKGKGKLLVCTTKLFENQHILSVRQYAKSLCEYILS